MNGGFEILGSTTADKFSDWTETASGVAIENSNTNDNSDTACKLSYSAGTECVYQDTTVLAGNQYMLTLYTRGDGSVSGRYRVYDVTNSADIVATATCSVTGTTYTKFTKAFRIPSSCTSLRIYLYAPSSSGDAYFDDVDLKLMSGGWAVIQHTGH